MNEIYSRAKVLCLCTKLPSIYAEIKIEFFEQYMVPSKILCRIEIFEKTFCRNKLIQKISHAIKKEKDLDILAVCLHDLKKNYCQPTAEVFDSE